MRGKLLCILVVTLLVVSVPAYAQESLSPGTAVEGESTGEAVLYSVDAEAGQLLLISMVSDAFDTLVVLSKDGSEVARDDDGGEGFHALLSYVVSESGTYTISAESSFGGGEGPFTLSVDSITPSAIAVGESAILEPAGDGSARLYAAFDAAEGAVVNVWATSQGDEDISVRLLGADGQEVDNDDDDGPGRNALLRRVVLPATGMNLVEVSKPFSDEPLLEAVEITIEATEPLMLSAEPQELVLGDGEGQTGVEVYTVEVTANVTYRFIATIQHTPDEEVGIRMTLLDTDSFFEPELEVQHATGASWDYIPNSSGTIHLEVHPNFFANDLTAINYTIALEVIE
jgi:hypothetical protein